MKRNHLIEALFLLSCMALFSFTDFIQQWDESRFTATYRAWQLKEKLALEASQTTRIEEINLAYYKKIRVAARTKFPDHETYCNIIKHARSERDAEILQTLTSSQQQAWKNIQAKECEKILTSLNDRKQSHLR